MIIASITGPTMADALRQVKRSAQFADCLEFRFDLIFHPEIGRLLASTKKPRIATCRRRQEGGMFSGSERNRVEMLEIASALGAEFVDIELKTEPGIIRSFLRRRSETKVILSHHVPGGPPANVSVLFRKMEETGADVIKLSYLAADGADIRHAVEFLKLARSRRRRAVAIAMGECGEATRIIYRVFGGWATYAAPENGPSAAPGQVRASVLRTLYRTESLDSRTRIYGVVGYPLVQSKGVFLHNPLFHSAGKNAVYCRFPVENLTPFMRSVAPLLHGFSVTIPHKRRIMRFLDKTDPEAKAIGAVNTVLRTSGGLRGLNTDAGGALDAIEAVAAVKGRTVLILGAGGAARAIAFEAKKRGANVVVTGRTMMNVKKLGSKLGVAVTDPGRIGALSFDILVNATPVGMFPGVNASPLGKQLLRKKIVFDAVYNPRLTALLRDALSVGAQVIPGTEMYLNQAAKQSELYTGRRPDRSTMKRNLGFAD